MRGNRFRPARRRFLGWLGALGAAAALPLPFPAQGRTAPITRAIPSSGERLPVIGMGSWLTFDVGDDPQALAQRAAVVRTFFARGGALIDSSPMYGSSEATLGYCLRHVDNGRALFAATKVWTAGRRPGLEQMERSRQLWGVQRFDLMQVHNLVDWRTQLESLRAMKADGRIRYLGVTTSHGRRHGLLEQLLDGETLDFVQLTYNMADREAERRLLPLAAERGVAVIVNRPFQRGGLFERARGRPVPGWAAEFDCANWAQFFLKFVVSHPAVTCAIPATSRVDHMRENMGALYGRLPDADMRRRMLSYFQSL